MASESLVKCGSWLIDDWLMVVGAIVAHGWSMVGLWCLMNNDLDIYQQSLLFVYCWDQLFAEG